MSHVHFPIPPVPISAMFVFEHYNRIVSICVPNCRDFIYSFSTECQNYQSINSADRKITYTTYHGYCDSGITPGWYRFEGAAGTRMPSSCTPSKRCGAHAVSWLTGGHPSVADGKVTRKVCFSYNGNCCFGLQNVNIEVKNCGSYYVYKLVQPGACSYRYCGTD